MLDVENRHQGARINALIEARNRSTVNVMNKRYVRAVIIAVVFGVLAFSFFVAFLYSLGNISRDSDNFPSDGSISPGTPLW